MSEPIVGPPLSGRALDAKLAEAMGWTDVAVESARYATGLPPEEPCRGYAHVPAYSTDVSALEPVYEEIERRGLGTEFTAELSLLIWPELPDSVRYDGYAWGILRATPEQHARAALSVLSQEGR